MKTVWLFFLLFAVWWSAALHAQSGFVSACADATDPSGSVSFSVGQLDYFTLYGPGGTVTQGIQQPFEIWVVSGMEHDEIALSMAVYPNPTADHVILKTENGDAIPLRYELFNMAGQLLATEDIVATNTKITLNQLPNGMYLLNVLENGQALKGFRIVKTQ